MRTLRRFAPLSASLLLLLASACSAGDEGASGESAESSEDALTAGIALEDAAYRADGHLRTTADIEMSPDGRFAIYEVLGPGGNSMTRFRDVQTRSFRDVSGRMKRRVAQGYLMTSPGTSSASLVSFDGTVLSTLPDANPTQVEIVGATQLQAGEPPEPWASSWRRDQFRFTTMGGTFLSAHFSRGAVHGFQAGAFLDGGAKYVWPAASPDVVRGPTMLHTAKVESDGAVTSVPITLEGAVLPNVEVMVATLRNGSSLYRQPWSTGAFGVVDLTTGVARRLSEEPLFEECGSPIVTRDANVYWMEATRASREESLGPSVTTTYSVRSWNRDQPATPPTTLTSFTRTIPRLSEWESCKAPTTLTLTEDGSYIVYLAQTPQRGVLGLEAVSTSGAAAPIVLPASRVWQDARGELFTLGKGSWIAYRTTSGFEAARLSNGQRFALALPPGAEPVAMALSRRPLSPALGVAMMNGGELMVSVGNKSTSRTRSLGTPPSMMAEQRMRALPDGSFLFGTSLPVAVPGATGIGTLLRVKP